MAKSRKTKAKNSDFQKVKLKVGKKLPKGQNETIATFKSRSIQIKEQLKSKDGQKQPTTRRKQSIQDLFTKCVHYSPNVRKDAVSGLEELLKAHPKTTQDHLRLLMERITSLFVDKAKGVRTATISLIKHLLSQLRPNQVAPFFPLLSAQICCAMTHLDEGVQESSLTLLDIILDILPEFVTSASSRILPSFLQLISCPKGKSSRTLLTNPNSKLTTQKWRLQVLQRLQKLLTALLQSCTEEEVIIKPIGASWQANTSEGITVLGSAAFHLHLSSSVAFSFSKHASYGTAGTGKQAGDVKDFVQMLVPLLKECEVETREGGDCEGNTLPSECLETVDKLIALLKDRQ